MIRLATAAVMVNLLMFPLASWAGEECPTAVLSARQAVALQEALFASLQAEDKDAWVRQTTPDFVAHEHGASFDRNQFFDLVVQAHAEGRKISWSVTTPTLETDCNLAIMIYTNIGSMTAEGQQPMPMRWLETVAFRRAKGVWKVSLVTSMRVENSGGAPTSTTPRNP